MAAQNEATAAAVVRRVMMHIKYELGAFFAIRPKQAQAAVADGRTDKQNAAYVSRRSRIRVALTFLHGADRPCRFSAIRRHAQRPSAGYR